MFKDTWSYYIRWRLSCPFVTMRQGNYTEVMEHVRSEDQYKRDQYQKTKIEARRLSAEAVRRKAEANGAQRKRSKRHLALHDSDGRAKIDAAIVSGADGRAGRIARQLEGRVSQVLEELDSYHIERRYDPHFWLPGSRAERPVLIHLDPAVVSMGERTLKIPELTIQRDDKIAINGANGTGKSTLIRTILEKSTLPQDHLIYIPQEIDAEESARIMSVVNNLPADELGQVMTIVSCLGTRPHRLVGNDDVSPGELRKVLLALGIARKPWLIVMDEPTNHLDLPAIECLENALAECPCALLIVSHDKRFISRVANTEWNLPF